jgi:hypothetical protein
MKTIRLIRAFVAIVTVGTLSTLGACTDEGADPLLGQDEVALMTTPLDPELAAAEGGDAGFLEPSTQTQPPPPIKVPVEIEPVKVGGVRGARKLVGTDPKGPFSTRYPNGLPISGPGSDPVLGNLGGSTVRPGDKTPRRFRSRAFEYGSVINVDGLPPGGKLTGVTITVDPGHVIDPKGGGGLKPTLTNGGRTGTWDGGDLGNGGLFWIKMPLGSYVGNALIE